MIRLVIEQLREKINTKFRFSVFFVLNKKQHILYECIDSEKGFIEDFMGLKLVVTEQFSLLLDEKNAFELEGRPETNYPFLYEGFSSHSSFYVHKIYLGNLLIGFLEIIIESPQISEDLKQEIESVAKELSLHLGEAYYRVSQEFATQFLCLEALQLIRTARPRTFYHSFRVADLSVAIARTVGLEEDMVKKLYFASLIHDVGEIWIPNDILDKRGKLSAEEMDLVRAHPMNLRAIFLHNPYIEDIVEIAVYHHERVDGKGYYGLKGEDIPYLSKILAISEFVDGLYTDRPDRPGFGIDKIIKMLKENKGIAFDEDLVDVAIRIIDDVYRGNEEFLGILPGKPAIILFYKERNLYLIKGFIEYSAGKNMGITLNTPEGKKLSYKDRVRVQLPTVANIVDLTAEVVSSTEDMVNLFVLESKDLEDKPLEVFWEFDILVLPLKVANDSLSKLISKDKKSYINMKTRIFGTKSMLARTTETGFSVGDTVLIRAKPLGETISIPAVISDVVDEGGVYTVRFEYFGLSEAEDAKIHRAIYSKQISSASR